MGLSIGEISTRLGMTKFSQICQKVDEKFGKGTKFDVVSVLMVGKKQIVTIDTENHKRLRLEM